MAKKILIVDDDQDALDLIKAVLGGTKDFEVLTACDGLKALEVVRLENPDLIILDIIMPGMDGITFKKELNQNETTAMIPVIFLTAKDAAPDKLEGFLLGADDYIAKPFRTDELVARVRSILHRRAFYENIFMSDPLTGLQNLNTYQKEVETFFNVAKRYQRMFSLAVVDIDDFKSINDTFGHQAGNAVIKKVADTMRRVLRKPDVPIRYGGDEFVILFPENSREQAASAVRRLKAVIEQSPVVVENGTQSIPVSVSAGVEAYHHSMASEAELFQLADKRMYEEKLAKKILREGRAKIVEDV
jgi:diguanylate cyclase (GGDEF)-like protein